ncbi:hypothetical protein [Megalodesulfovibrio gigas]|uniref:Uncharacterized protein n=1 Tax=Megalodesulfovibrio gigas (strain ATCC 19364 / DSM 1382 / NCIMB 9332 / VKM B-1759) TaxID=1121448 RepID=T2GAD9_MEGG1|nr:hypothetical protein [Megalodesulfovibrio gigas]AGW13550.1 hypothetical protein DGI_1736 [Megalodesulfovibrio gigas DSM 1382 = ATCC 19364]
MSGIATCVVTCWAVGLMLAGAVGNAYGVNFEDIKNFSPGRDKNIVFKKNQATFYGVQLVAKGSSLVVSLGGKKLFTLEDEWMGYPVVLGESVKVARDFPQPGMDTLLTSMVCGKGCEETRLLTWTGTDILELGFDFGGMTSDAPTPAGAFAVLYEPFYGYWPGKYTSPKAYKHDARVCLECLEMNSGWHSAFIVFVQFKDGKWVVDAPLTRYDEYALLMKVSAAKMPQATDRDLIRKELFCSTVEATFYAFMAGARDDQAAHLLAKGIPEPLRAKATHLVLADIKEVIKELATPELLKQRTLRGK